MSLVMPGAIDVHAHWYPQPFLDLLRDHGPEHGLEWKETGNGPQFKIRSLITGPAGPRFVDLDTRLQAMGEQGVEVHALSLSQPMVYWAGRELGNRLCVTYNNELAKAHERNRRRFFGLAALPMHEPDLALRELERAAKLPGIRGVYMATTILDRELSNEAFFPVYEALQGLGLPMYLHPVFVIGEDRLRQFYLTNLLGNPFETAIAGAHLIFSGVMDRFPKMEVVLPHAGGALPWLAGRLTRGWEKRAELKNIRQPPVDYLRRFWYDTVGYSDPVAEYLVKNIGADRIVMGSDYCFPIAYEQPVKNVTDNPLLTEEIKHAIVAGNARRLLRL
jgi:aminocarboxymuconate-semialdehyde decarboxylase